MLTSIVWTVRILLQDIMLHPRSFLLKTWTKCPIQQSRTEQIDICIVKQGKV